MGSTSGEERSSILVGEPALLCLSVYDMRGSLPTCVGQSQVAISHVSSLANVRTSGCRLLTLLQVVSAQTSLFSMILSKSPKSILLASCFLSSSASKKTAACKKDGPGRFCHSLYRSNSRENMYILDYNENSTAQYMYKQAVIHTTLSDSLYQIQYITPHDTARK